MTNLVLSPYQAFFIDETEKLWMVLKDGRTRFVKNTPAFSNISANYTYICGVEFNGEHTFVERLTFGFTDEDTKPLFHVFGYCYYPTITEEKHPRLALLKADLLNKSGTADLIVYKQARTKFHPQFQMMAQIVPPVWDNALLYYVTAKGQLVRTNGKTGERLADKALLFALNKAKDAIAYYDGETIYQVSLETGNTHKTMAFGVTALGYNADNELLFATENGDSYIIQKYNRQTGEVEPVARSAVAVKMIL
ncbi:MAG: hypothetical protein IKY98_00690 [Alphaproteobacteria bacterium]|nr:hypothetical protein [Alphaproteobacteria bacterium]